MGYTLYWTYKKTDDKPTSFTPELKAKLEDAIKVASSHGIALGCWDGTKAQCDLVADSNVTFNGLTPESCETFNLYCTPPPGYRDFCKTNRKAYTVVCMRILQLALEAGILEDWKTDGDDEEIKEQYNNIYKGE